MRNLRTALAALAVLSLAAAACGKDVTDTDELRRALNRSQIRTRTFEFREASRERVYTITGTFQDDFRFTMRLSKDGKGIAEQVVSDDAMALRLDAQTAATLGGALGHPDVVAALTGGRWVIDPSGAPPVTASRDAATVAIRSPFDEALNFFETIRRSMSEASGVVEFNQESIEYRPQRDPWEYPDLDDDELRYDLIRPFLPKSEDQMIAGGAAGGQSDVTEPQFRKLSIFVRNQTTVYQVCSLVDVRGHEDFVKAREERKNKFLLALEQRIRKGDTTTPIREREIFATFDYDDDVAVALPRDAVTGKLDRAKEAMEKYLSDTVLRPRSKGLPDIDDCDRREPIDQ